jgi:hypothetical protein
MDMNLDTENDIYKYLVQYDLDNFDSLDTNTKEQIISIEEYFKKCELKLTEVKKLKNEIKLDITGVCSNVEAVGKTTIYKKELLRVYISKRIASLKSKFKDMFVSEQFEQLEKGYKEMQELVDDVKINLVGIIQKNDKIARLEKENRLLQEKFDKAENEKKQHANLAYELQQALMQSIDNENKETKIFNLKDQTKKRANRMND